MRSESDKWFFGMIVFLKELRVNLWEDSCLSKELREYKFSVTAIFFLFKWKSFINISPASFCFCTKYIKRHSSEPCIVENSTGRKLVCCTLGIFLQNRFGMWIFWGTADLAFASKSCYILAKPVPTASIEGIVIVFSLYPSCMCRRLCFLFYFDALRACVIWHILPHSILSC